jgi:hypothetical protein
MEHGLQHHALLDGIAIVLNSFPQVGCILQNLRRLGEKPEVSPALMVSMGMPSGAKWRAAPKAEPSPPKTIAKSMGWEMEAKKTG